MCVDARIFKHTIIKLLLIKPSPKLTASDQNSDGSRKKIRALANLIVVTTSISILLIIYKFNGLPTDEVAGRESETYKALLYVFSFN